MKRGRSHRGMSHKSPLGAKRLYRREVAALAMQATLGGCPRPDKRRYPNKKEAKAAIRRANLDERGTLHAYRCPCGGFHIGHRRRRVELELEPQTEAAA